MRSLHQIYDDLADIYLDLAKHTQVLTGRDDESSARCAQRLHDQVAATADQVLTLADAEARDARRARVVQLELV